MAAAAESIVTGGKTGTYYAIGSNLRYFVNPNLEGFFFYLNIVAFKMDIDKSVGDFVDVNHGICLSWL